ncbi:hypothetical protein ABGT15_04450 [Flavobacterium enshiense]|uniref:hypothetical protein n=1 Tax=Flavobacterium enshiense TaxID=1341165 RepID=UPI00345D80E6
MFKVNDRAILKYYKEELEKEMKFIKQSSTHQPIQDHIQNTKQSLKEYLFNNLDNMLADSYRNEESENKINKLKEKLTDIEDNYIPKVVLIN